MTNGTDADFLKVLLGEAREDPLVDLVIAECRLVFFEAEAAQPPTDVHDGAPSLGSMMIEANGCVQMLGGTVQGVEFESD